MNDDDMDLDLREPVEANAEVVGTLAITEADMLAAMVDMQVVEQAQKRFALLTADTPDGYKEVRQALTFCRQTRTTIEQRRVELKAPALEHGRRVDAVAKELIALIKVIEDPLTQKRTAADAVKAKAKAEREAAAREAREAEARAAVEAQAQANRAAAERLAAQEAQLAADRAALDAEKLKMAELQAAHDLRERQAQEAQLAAELAAELAAAAPDSEKLVAYVVKLTKVAVPVMATQTGKDQLAAVQRLMQSIAQTAQTFADRVAQ